MAKDIIKEVLERNEGYEAGWAGIQDGQQPKITLVTCSDSRISGHIFNKDLVNFVFHIRNIGNQLVNAFGSVDYGVHHLKTPVLLILGHSGCGAVKASQSDFSGETDAIKDELYPLFFNLSKAGSDAKDPRHFTRLAQHNVDIQVAEAVRRYGTDHTFVVGAMFDIHGHYTEKKGRVIITNINGVKDAAGLRAHPLLSGLEAGLRDAKARRL